jgi:lysophospholipase L1-like esterase
MRRVKRMLEIGGIVCWVSISSLLLLEAALRIHNPLHTSVRGNQIVLTANMSWTYSGGASSQLDKRILHRKNNIGFRGEDYDSGTDALRIFTIGGSTTEDVYLTEGKTWSDDLRQLLAPSFHGLWLNNAGFTGHSTFAHQILLQDHIAKYQPDVLLFLVGINDVDRSELEEKPLRFWEPKIFDLATHSELVTLGLNLYRAAKARNRKIGHNTEGLREDWLVTWEIRQEEKQAAIDRNEGLLGAYHGRLTKLVETSRGMGAEPIIITQPVLYGEGIDDRTGLDLSKIYVSPVDGKTAWNILQRYNDIARKVAFENNVLLVDLAVQLPKSSRYFYDTIHFTNEGSSAVAHIVYRSICGPLMSRFENYAVASCSEVPSGPSEVLP